MTDLQEIERAYAKIQGILAKAVQEDEEDDDELSRDLDQDLEAYARLKKGQDPRLKAKGEDGEDEDLDLEMRFDEDEDGEDEDGDAVKETRAHEEEEMAVLTALVQALRSLKEHLEAVADRVEKMEKGQKNLEAALLQIAKQNVAVAKALVGVGHAMDLPGLPKSGRRGPAPEPARQAGDILAKAAQAKDLFSAFDVAALESMLNRGDYEAIRMRFSPAQLKFLGLE
ncbi:hypothetical protein [Thermus antranikianii]|uniref:hypothetical protein n=1 Tax=Thermus antranikianii TaxID=88190 RepID=UPI000F854A70|nr:hypothetical protein [Thermus antranikianii]AYJ74841.1 hypothetical protein phiMa_58 [Thermus phage phiMa]QWK23113.1 MAG: hypothetical protein KNN15_06710 [Thermus antranikianii]